MSRNATQQKRPQDGLDLADFPSVPAPEGVVFRAYNTANGPGYYSSHLTGRFDLADPNGTLYFGDDISTAIRESLGELAYGKAITAGAASARAVVETELPSTGPFAHISSEKAVRFGVLRELQTMPRYTVPQAWAQAFFDAGFMGIRYPSRFTTAEKANAWAVFGPAGPTDLPYSGVSSGHAACQLAGIRVTGRSTPRKVSFTFLGSP